VHRVWTTARPASSRAGSGAGQFHAAYLLDDPAMMALMFC
jgi:hypothetical protein